jgi:hypothetical protein
MRGIKVTPPWRSLSPEVKIDLESCFFARLKDVAGFGHLLVSKRCFAIEEDHDIIKEAKPNTFFQAVGEILPMRARHPYITPPICRRELYSSAPKLFVDAFAVNLN